MKDTFLFMPIFHLKCNKKLILQLSFQILDLIFQIFNFSY